MDDIDACVPIIRLIYKLGIEDGDELSHVERMMWRKWNEVMINDRVGEEVRDFL